MNRLGWLTMRRRLAVSVVASVLMVAAAAGAMSLKSTTNQESKGITFDLHTAIPNRIGNWEFASNEGFVIADPQARRLADQIYSQLIARTYVNANTGDRIMLSIAYGKEQRDTRQIHLPEVCYPAQGFQIVSKDKSVVKTELGDIDVQRLVAASHERIEPITYWITVGNRIVNGDINTKIEQLRHRRRGEIPDGVIFRVSSIARDSDQEFQLQARFVQEFVRSVSPIHLQKLTGIRPSQITISDGK